ncbi:nicotinate phosphoribosyltransferase [Deinococcus soli (ex Cha et al. 2016)]|uniref:Nicotinamide phosphoribosyltransferase n=2 Tax=Deinococcus soli (ex Cha et al. 2016) TaxID=1309411 RepID=A0AAE3XGZ5_9DEIO|nr:nicotinate phosphoribosyltransferase [Deinococcus soli (ex Cha et al. 2016)]MDR6221247.1 nicotinamide phosphoribosyltransferase [Deinococcus soli (ex Cha et al. 2016)]MDR6331199.1 nicotinamide phosphoribosyltransferase [Deinococcus soli (ex Cha et al. 2016)]MDR6754416.1 nicotinamide phosphoribosyltransferase [Deinococcus soli (ex Cha et al. 2016)]
MTIPLNDRNIILDTDSYKSSHFLQYPKGTTRLFSYLESRGGKYPQTRFFGLQYILDRYLTTRVTADMVEEARALIEAHGEPFPYDGWMRVVNVHGGKLPLEVRAVPEGTLVPIHNVLLSCTNTDPELPWLVGWFETMLMRVWYPTTVATQSWHIREIIRAALEKTSDRAAEELPFKLHDFGSRGVSSRESAGIGGLAHLINFQGSDTLEALRVARNHYGADIAAFSIPAAEHSTITSWGKEHEVDAYRNMITQFSRPGSIYAVVSDSYDLKNAINTLWGEELKADVIASGGTLVVRPDSGEPPAMVRLAVNALAAKYGTTTNSRGYKVLNHVRVIQGDGIDEQTIRQILDNLDVDGYSAENVSFGMGGALLQKVDRDTQRFAYKASAGLIDGAYRGIYKDPVTDPGKRSKDGVLDLVQEGGRMVTKAYKTFDTDFPGSLMRTVYKDGELIVRDTLETIRGRG